MRIRSALSAVAVGALAVTMAACGSGNGGSTGDGGGSDASGGADGELSCGEITFWHYEGDDSAMNQSWLVAIDEWEAATGGTVKVEKQTFEQLQKNAKIVLTGDDVPDVMEYNKGNGTAGQLASQGLLTELDDYAADYGWDSVLPSSIQTTARYDEDGLMGSGPWFGVPTYGEYVTVYYNEEMFADNGIEVPTTFAELEAALDAFVAAGITPLAEAGAEYPMGQLWYQLVLHHADRDFVDAFQLFDGDVDFTSGPLKEGTDTLQGWIDKGYINPNASGLTAEDMGVAFIAGKYPVMVSGSWWFGRLNAEISDFTLGQMIFPENSLNAGSSGNLLVIPTNAKEKDCAASFIDTALAQGAQNKLAELGGLPVAGDASVITDENVKVLTQNWDAIVADDGLAFYPDWPVAGFYDQVVSFGQSLLNGSKTPDQALDTLGTFYQEGRADITGE